MSDVSVNIRGRDDGLGSTLDSLREKAKQFGRDMGNLDKFDSLTKTEKKLEIEKVSKGVAEEQKRKIREEYASARQENIREFETAKTDLSQGNISKTDFRVQQKRFNESQSSLSKEEEDSELLAVDKESNNYLKQILRQLLLQERLDNERKQRDGGEFVEGSIGDFLNQNRQLRGRQKDTTDQAELDLIQSQIESNNARINALRNGGDTDEESSGNGRFGAGLQQGAMGAARGDLSGTVMGGLQMGGEIGGLARGLTIAGIIAMVIKEFAGHGEKIQEAIGQTSSMRGGRGDANTFNKQLQNIISSEGMIGNLGLSGDEFAGIVNQKATASRVSGNNVAGRAMDDYAFQKGFGADVGMFSEFERFTKTQESATTIGLDVLNVLTSIEKSSLKEGDLSTLAEKLGSQQAILSIQRNKRDSVDSDSALRVLTAFENIGLSGKGEKGGSFLSQTIEGLGEGGGDNAMLLKYEAAKRARPDLANDPAALRRFVKFNSDDPKYMSEMFKFMGQVSGGSETSMDDMIYTMFNPQSEADMDMYKKAMGGDKSFMNALAGQGINKSRKSTLNRDQMYDDAQSSVGSVTNAMKDFSNTMQEMLILLKGVTSKPIDVNVKNQPKSTNTTRTGN